MKKFFNLYFTTLSIFLVKIALKINSHRLCGFILWLNIKRVKKIKTKLVKSKKILLFPKSGGFDDLIESFSEKKNNISFYLLPRGFLKEIFWFFFEQDNNSDFGDYFTKLRNKKKN